MEGFKKLKGNRGQSQGNKRPSYKTETDLLVVELYGRIEYHQQSNFKGILLPQAIQLSPGL